MDYPDLPTLAARLRWARETLRGWTQEKLGERSGVGRDVVAKTELGGTQMPRRINKLAQALEVSPGWLAFGVSQLDELSKDALKIALTWEALPDDDPQKKAIKELILAREQSLDC